MHQGKWRNPRCSGGEQPIQQRGHRVSSKVLVNFRILVTGMQLAKEFYGELSNVCQVKALPGSVPQNNPPDSSLSWAQLSCKPDGGAVPSFFPATRSQWGKKWVHTAPKWSGHWLVTRHIDNQGVSNDRNDHYF